MADMYKATLVPTDKYPSEWIIDFPDEMVTHSLCFEHNLAVGLDDMNSDNPHNLPLQVMVNGTTTLNRIDLPFLLNTMSGSAYEYNHYTHTPIKNYAESGTIPPGFPIVDTYNWGNTTVWFAKEAGCSDDPGIHVSQQYEQTSINLGGWGD